MTNKKQIGIRISQRLLARLYAITKSAREKYPPKMTDLIERGLELAIEEYERDRKRR